MLGVDSQTLSAEAQASAYVVLGIVAAIGGFFAQRAAKKSTEQRKATQVPTGVDQEYRDPGAVLAEMRTDIHEAASSAKAAYETAGRAAAQAAEASAVISSKVESLALSFARHEGQHEGLKSDIDMVKRKVMNNGGKDG